MKSFNGKKWATVVASASILSLTLAACSSGGVSTESTGSTGTTEATVSSLELWLPTAFGSNGTKSEEQALKGMLSLFEEEHDVTVNLTLIPWDSYEAKYLTGVASGQGPDVGYMYTEMMGDYIKEGALAPFDDYLSADATANMLYLENGKIDGQQYALPWVVGGMRVLWANMDVLEAAGVTTMPTTWDEFLRDSQKVKESGKVGILSEWGAPDRGMLNSTYFPLLWQAGGDIFNKEGTATAFNSEAGLAAANVIKTLLDSGSMPNTVSALNSQDVKDAFNAGGVGFMFGADNQLADFEDVGFRVEFIPSLKGMQRATFVASDSLVMLDKCPDKQLCTDLTEFLLAGPQMTTFHKDVVPYPPVGSDETITGDNPFFEFYVNDADILKSLPIVPGANQVYNALYENLQQMVLGQKTPEQALSDAAKAGDLALQDN